MTFRAAQVREAVKVRYVHTKTPVRDLLTLHEPGGRLLRMPVQADNQGEFALGEEGHHGQATLRSAW
ncbi:hypothetical protein SAMN05216553_12819 [Lentzea fradiae]|uniref:Uncharacterized protein n=1 Tax=Lentzea fradiae TaxID=200378 RepID=A0A1G8DDX0_9PSEU|nr:hypothetical protein SAMN05216553_12819 [Lentzea fradiae]